MNRGERWLLDLANIVVGGTGVVYAVMKFLMDPVDEWAVVNHPWQPHVQHLHVVVAPLLVFAVGLYWKGHISGKLSEGQPAGRVSGWVLTLQFVPVVLSGYLIQVVVSQGWRSVWVWVHLVTGSLWIVAVMAHRFRANTDRSNRLPTARTQVEWVNAEEDQVASTKEQMVDDDPTADGDQHEASDDRHP